MRLKYGLYLLLMGVATLLRAQTATLSGTITEGNDPLPAATVVLKGTAFVSQSDNDGRYVMNEIPYGNYTLTVFAFGKQTVEQPVVIDQPSMKFSFELHDIVSNLEEVVVEGEKESVLGASRLQGVENFAIHEGKKTEVILLQNLTANMATNNPRQIYSRVTGLNIWESDGVGLQLGIGGRGLSPNRTSNFNTRQNGYDISADALGYPESYYTPPAEALDRIEIIRGAASLQYGTQFGGMLNFRFKQGPRDKKIEFTTRQSFGSWNFFGTFNSIGGTVAKGKLNYYAYYQYKRGDGYRANSDFDYHNAYTSLNYQVTDKLLVNFEYTHMYYLAHQAGGLTDKMFEDDPRQSVRDRNWFKVNWNLMAVNLTYTFSPMTQLNIRNFGLLAQRQSLGNLERINVADDGGNRTLIDGDFNNIGNETRLLHRYQLLGRTHAFVAGIRMYYGYSTAKQGDGNDGSGPDFYFLHPEAPEYSDYSFPNRNNSAFIENVFEVNDKLSITPGIRFENIQTYSDGYYFEYTYDGAGNLISKNKVNDNLERKRNFAIAGIGISYKAKPSLELYGNISQNYRAINFTDLRIVNPNFVVDPNIHDEKGYTADGGIRGSALNAFTYEVTAFYVAYKDRIGQVGFTDENYIYKRRRGNISDARIVGVESFAEMDITKLFSGTRKYTITLFANTSFIDAQYVHTEDNSIRGNKVEMVPPIMLRTGTTFKWKTFTTSLQFSYTGEHFTDATNAKRTASAVEGLIPAYKVMDLSTSYTWKFLTLEATCNNLLNEKYFTRRAESYPGPGIIPSDGRGFYCTIQAKF